MTTRTLQTPHCPDSIKTSLLADLKACSKTRNLTKGKIIHEDTMRTGEASDTCISNSLIHMYSKCGILNDALKVFEEMENHTVVSWNVIILGFVEHGEAMTAIDFFCRMRHEGYAHDDRTFLAAFKACTALGSECKSKVIHLLALISGCVSNMYAESCLVTMYSKTGIMAYARVIFDRIRKPDVVAWNALLLGYAENGDNETAIVLFCAMESPDSRTFIAVLKASICKERITEGYKARCRALHMRGLCSGFDLDMYVASTLVDMYASCGCMEEAQMVFEKMKVQDVVSWNALIMGYANNRHGGKALALFSRMYKQGCEPMPVTFVAALKACTNLVENSGRKIGELSHMHCNDFAETHNDAAKSRSREIGRAIHMIAASNGFDLNLFVQSTMVDMYAKCGSLQDGLEVFDRMTDRNVVSWNALMMGYARSGDAKAVLKLFVRMKREDTEPDSLSCVSALLACTSLIELDDSFQETGKAVHLDASRTGCDSSVHVAGRLVDMYAKCRNMEEARRIFDRVKDPDVVLWTALCFGYANNGEGRIALDLFARMKQEGYGPDARTLVASIKACTCLAKDGDHAHSMEIGQALHLLAVCTGCVNDFVESTLLDMYATCGCMEEARRVFYRGLRKHLVSWNALLKGYVENGQGKTVLELFSCMKNEMVEPNVATFLAVLKACAMLGAHDFGKIVHQEICSRGLQENTALSNCLTDFYAKSGNVTNAKQVFTCHAAKDLVSWNALMTGYSRCGNTTVVFDLFGKMECNNLHPDNITFSIILAACSHAGLVEQGKEFFKLMSTKYGLKPKVEHYTTLIDIFGRANKLEDALFVLRSMPLDPDAVTWTTVLGSCRKWKNVELGRLAYESLLCIDRKYAGNYVLMSNIVGHKDSKLH